MYKVDDVQRPDHQTFQRLYLRRQAAVPEVMRLVPLHLRQPIQLGLQGILRGRKPSRCSSLKRRGGGTQRISFFAFQHWGKSSWMNKVRMAMIQ